MLTGEALDRFLQRSWQSEPVVFRGAINTADFPVPPQQLCELTENELVESRLIDSDSSLAHGPFDFEPPAAPGPLLADGQLLMVQCLEQHLQVGHELLDQHFSFLARWQVDDVMASLGYEGASCGAHFDRYDVFLVQLCGSKTWQLDRGNHQEADLRDDVDIRLLSDFTPTEDYLLEPGDVLYIPPGIGHHGICHDECITLSVGIRNPTIAEFLADLSEFALEVPGSHSQVKLDLHASPRIGPEDTHALQAVTDQLFSDTLYQRWYGCFVTRLRNPEILQRAAAQGDLRDRVLRAVPASRLACCMLADEALLFVNGDIYVLATEDAEWIEKLCNDRSLQVPANLSERSLATLTLLVELGALAEH